ncbi:hypothetical protein J5N97_005727 [Dioscorea zingiberensis]|uniref:Bifunctional inhibitor/plant lipid transfer protein/seed storage helical domain-containing protein n=1 Tax=Dioscorea zingiberensis TaxID=325984 RepID=A0A9D5D902_9LILI|nr:hypothetical protein J5N97_005727 [Dioscorea zingiberensis]
MACMKTPWMFMVCMLVLTVGMAVDGAVPVGAPAAMDCSDAILNLADCLSFVQVGSSVEKPEGKCCSGLKKVVKEDVSCLCEAFKRGADFGVKINMTKALALPHSCGVRTPSISNCKIAVAGGPSSAPAPSPVAPFSETPASAPETHSSARMALQSPSMVLAMAIVLFFVWCY